MKSLLKKIGLAAKRAASSRGPDGSRHVNINAPQEEKFAGNAIATGKYNIITFVPLFLFSQFKRAANVFFLVISILQQVPNVSPTGQWTTLGPLMIILSISALREIAEDYRRQRDDDQTNNDVTLKLTVNQTTGLVEWAREKWKDIEVGNILKITSGRQFPADLILLASSEPKGMAYIETSNLDGETNLKLKQALPETANYTNDDEISQLRGECEAEAPTKHLYEFYGNIEIGQRSLDGQRIPVDASQLLLRGSQLRNTKFVYGLVVYTGQETKLMKNSRQAPLKQSSVEYSVNYQILYMFLALLVLAIISTIGNILTSKWICYHWYMWNITDVPNAPFSANLTASQASDDLLGGDTECGEVTTTRVVKSLMTFLILYNNVVPISLLVTIEVVKYVQAILISFDEEMEHNGILAKARTSNLNEELGQISYIFTDKTGTLTENIMEFKKCSINGKLYSADEEAADFLNADGTHKSHEDSYQVTMRHLNELFDKREKPHEADRVSIFMRMMAVCQTVVPEINDDMEIEYQASSPDEAALVQAASNLGFEFVSRSPNSVDVKERIDGQTVKRRYRVLHVLEFNSTRKRMSVVVRDEQGRIIVFCKGADNVVYERLKATGKDSADCVIEAETLKHLEDFATVGLRTLCFAYCELDSDFYEQWKENDFKPASTSVIDREKKLDTAYAKIEKDFTLVGASAIEDRLQDQVPETIYMMRQAGISVWMLTGDKQETAINIGFSCNLIDQTQELFSLDTDSLEATKERLKAYRQRLDDLAARGENREIALIITGRTMKFVFRSSTRENFMFLSLKCKSVICCRVSPSQKADIVKAVRKEVTDSITLAIGDGANDVPMIQSAHIGIGISGQEGLQAANASDYSIAQFRFLQRLLLVHGVCNYWRLVKCILYSFYKNITLYLIELWFAIFNGWSGQILFDRWAITCYNVLFTFWPPIVIGWFERPCEPGKLLAKPQLYSNTQKSLKFNGIVFWKMFMNSIFHSFLLFFLTFLCYSDMEWGESGFTGFASEMLSPNGQTGGYLYIGNFVYTYVIITVMFKISLETSTWTFWNWLSVIGSGALWFLYVLMFGRFWPSIRILSPVHMAGQEQQIFSSAVFWLGAMIIPFITILRDLAYKVYRYQTADQEPDSFKNERIRDEDRMTFRHFFKETKTNIEQMALIHSKKQTGLVVSNTELARPTYQTSNIRTGNSEDPHRGYAFNQCEGEYGVQETIIRADRTPKEKQAKT